FFQFLREFGKTISREIYKIKSIIYIIKIYALGSPWLGTGSGQFIAIYQLIDHGGLPYSAASSQSNLRIIMDRKIFAAIGTDFKTGIIKPHPAHHPTEPVPGPHPYALQTLP